MRFIGWFLACGCLMLVGCSDAPELVQVQGSVSLGGRPLPGVVVQFHPEDGRPSFGISDAEGKFSLSYNKHYEGARLGKHRVYVAFDRAAAPFDEAGRQKLTADQRAILARYGELDSSPLEVELTEDDQPVELKLD